MKVTAMNTPYDSLYLFIGGEWIDTEGRKTATVRNPATEEVIGQVPLATADELDLALETAKLAFEQWRNTVPAERARVLKRAADLILERATHIAAQMTLEEGKPIGEAMDEVTRAAEYFEWFAESARRIDGRVVPANRPGVLQLVKRQPIGPVAAFTPGTSRRSRQHANCLPRWRPAAALFSNLVRKAPPLPSPLLVPWMMPGCRKVCCRSCLVCPMRSQAS